MDKLLQLFVVHVLDQDVDLLEKYRLYREGENTGKQGQRHDKSNGNIAFSLNRLLGRQSTSRDVCLCVCGSVPSQNTLFRRLWRLLVELRPPNIGT